MSYVAEVVVVGIRWPIDLDLGAEDRTVWVLYCDSCHRWGRVGTTHLCGDTWAKSLGDLLLAFAAERA